MTSKEEIIETAILIFAAKGKYGARQEEIAQQAGINKAMLYYYFSNKDTLFCEALYKVQKTIYEEVEKQLVEIIDSPEAPEVKMRQFVEMHFKVFSKNKTYTQLYLQGLANEPEVFKQTFQRVMAASDKGYLNIRPIFEQGQTDQVFRDADFTQIAISIIGMNLIYFMAKPIAEVILNVNVANEEKFLSERLESITSLLMHGIIRA